MVLANLANVTRVPDLRRRLLFTLMMLAVYRIGVFITAPGVNRNAMKSVIATKGTGLIGIFNLFSGGALENLSIFALGIMPYISMSIIISLLGMVYKPIEELRKEGEQGRRKIDQYTRMGTVILAAFQARPPRTTRHICSNIVITVESATRARGSSAMLLFTAADTPPLVGGFDDAFVLTSDGWRFAERRGSLAF